MSKTNKLTLTAMIAALTTLTSHFIYIPLGFAKVFPMQHFANVITAILCGPTYAVTQALIVSTTRIMLGTGSIFAFPGSMIGAWLAGIFFAKRKKLSFAVIGEVIGTGLIGALISYPIAHFLFGQQVALFGFVPAFMTSSFIGALLGYSLLKVLMKNQLLGGIIYENSTNDCRF